MIIDTNNRLKDIKVINIIRWILDMFITLNKKITDCASVEYTSVISTNRGKCFNLLLGNNSRNRSPQRRRVRRESQEDKRETIDKYVKGQ
ncbi:hypothetical protein HY792_05175 [Candidatus Desantisbacteria bacterium]|nr:hypothetical protein [Candidatus Desantisbacteria bacterium]